MTMRVLARPKKISMRNLKTTGERAERRGAGRGGGRREWMRERGDGRERREERE